MIIGLVITGELISFAGFVQRHPTVIFNLLTLALASAAGQVGSFGFLSSKYSS